MGSCFFYLNEILLQYTRKKINIIYNYLIICIVKEKILNNKANIQDEDIDLIQSINLDHLLSSDNDIDMKILNDELGYITDIGITKKENQDFAQVGFREDGVKIMVVADGVSTSEYSAESARFSCDYILKNLKKRNSFNKKYIENVLSELNCEIIKKQKQKKIKNSYLSTIILAIIKDDEIIVAWLGDSRAYLVNEEQGYLLTRDDSYVNELIARGQLSSNEAKSHPKKNVITQCIGIEHDHKRGIKLKINIKSFKILKDFSLLLCTDGLWGSLDLTKGVKFKKSIEVSLMKMIREANRAGGKDNITCALYKKK